MRQCPSVQVDETRLIKENTRHVLKQRLLLITEQRRSLKDLEERIERSIKKFPINDDLSKQLESKQERNTKLANHIRSRIVHRKLLKNQMNPSIFPSIDSNVVTSMQEELNFSQRMFYENPHYLPCPPDEVDRSMIFKSLHPYAKLKSLCSEEWNAKSSIISSLVSILPVYLCPPSSPGAPPRLSVAIDIPFSLDAFPSLSATLLGDEHNQSSFSSSKKSNKKIIVQRILVDDDLVTLSMEKAVTKARQVLISYKYDLLSEKKALIKSKKKFKFESNKFSPDKSIAAPLLKTTTKECRSTHFNKRCSLAEKKKQRTAKPCESSQAGVWLGLADAEDEWDEETEMKNNNINNKDLGANPNNKSAPNINSPSSSSSSSSSCESKKESPRACVEEEEAMEDLNDALSDDNDGDSNVSFDEAMRGVLDDGKDEEEDGDLLLDSDDEDVDWPSSSASASNNQGEKQPTFGRKTKKRAEPKKHMVPSLMIENHAQDLCQPSIKQEEEEAIPMPKLDSFLPPSSPLSPVLIKLLAKGGGDRILPHLPFSPSDNEFSSNSIGVTEGGLSADDSIFTLWMYAFIIERIASVFDVNLSACPILTFNQNTSSSQSHEKSKLSSQPNSNSQSSAKEDLFSSNENDDSSFSKDPRLIAEKKMLLKSVYALKIASSNSHTLSSHPPTSNVAANPSSQNSSSSAIHCASSKVATWIQSVMPLPPLRDSWRTLGGGFVFSRRLRKSFPIAYSGTSTGDFEAAFDANPCTASSPLLDSSSSLTAHRNEKESDNYNNPVALGRFDESEEVDNNGGRTLTQKNVGDTVSAAANGLWRGFSTLASKVQSVSKHVSSHVSASLHLHPQYSSGSGGMPELNHQGVDSSISSDSCVQQSQGFSNMNNNNSVNTNNILIFDRRVVRLSKLVQSVLVECGKQTGEAVCLVLLQQACTELIVAIGVDFDFERSSSISDMLGALLSQLGVSVKGIRDGLCGVDIFDAALLKSLRMGALNPSSHDKRNEKKASPGEVGMVQVHDRWNLIGEDICRLKSWLREHEQSPVLLELNEKTISGAYSDDFFGKTGNFISPSMDGIDSKLLFSSSGDSATEDDCLDSLFHILDQLHTVNDKPGDISKNIKLHPAPSTLYAPSKDGFSTTKPAALVEDWAIVDVIDDTHS